MTPGRAEERSGSVAAHRRSVRLLLLLVAVSWAVNVWYASGGLDSGRWWDERFSLENVRGILESGSLRPSNGFYQALSYLPQTAVLAASGALHRWTGIEALAVLEEDGRFTATAYLLCRLLQTLYGAGSLLAAFAVGRRLFSPGIGLLGAGLLAVTPWHVQASTIYKPDVLLMFTVLLTVAWSLRALEPGPQRPGDLRRWLLAGCGAALAASAKLNGALACVPLLVAVAGSEGSWRQRAGRLIAAVGAGLAVFALVNPFFFLYPAYLDVNLDHYSARAEAAGGTHLDVLWREAGLIASWQVHGPALGALALAAGAVFALGLLRRVPRDGSSRVEGWTFLSFPVAYSLAYAVVTPHLKGNNFVPVFPFTALLAAWGLARLWRFVTERRPRVGPRWIGRSWIGWGAAVLLVAALAANPVLYAYRHRVPTTEELARSFLRGRFERHGPTLARLVYGELPGGGIEAGLAGPRAPSFTLVPVARLGKVNPDRLDAADGELFPVSRLEEDGGSYGRRLAAVPARAAARFTPGFLTARGPELFAVAHPWVLAGPERRIEVGPSDLERGSWQVELSSPLERGETLSIQLWGRWLREAPRLEVASEAVALHPVALRRGGGGFLSDRLVPASDPFTLRLAVEPEHAEGLALEVTLLRWRRPAPRGATPAGAGGPTR